MDACISRYGGMVWSIANKYARAQADAEDLVQETFTALWRSAGRYDARVGTEATFIGVLARRRAIDWLRKQGRRLDLEPLSSIAFEMKAPAKDPSSAVDHETVMQAVRRLPEETQRLFRFHFEGGLSHSEIANETGMSLGTVKTRLRRGLIELRNLMGHLDAPQQGGATS